MSVNTATIFSSSNTPFGVDLHPAIASNNNVAANHFMVSKVINNNSKK